MYTCPMHPEIKQNHPANCPICHMRLVKESEKTHDASEKESYTPLLVIFLLLLLTTTALGLRDWYAERFSLLSLISYFMTGFFLVFSGFKLMDLRGFADGYATYDLLARKWYLWGYLYPFLELFLGITMLVHFQPTIIIVLEILLMGFSGIGVLIKVLKKEQFQCACLGTFLKVPLTSVTLLEDFGMMGLGIVLLLLS